MERGERDLVRLVVQVDEREKEAPRREDWGEADAEVVVEEVVDSVEEWVLCALFCWLRLVERERRRAVNGEGKGAGIRLMMSDGDDEAASIVVSRPSKKVIKSGTALVKVSLVMGGRRMELVLLTTGRIIRSECFERPAKA